MECKCSQYTDLTQIQSEDEDRKGLWKSRSRYTLPTKTGNWNEDLYLQEDLMKIASYKRDSCDLLTLKTRKMFRNLLKPVDLAKETPMILYGYPYQIEACHVPNTIVPEIPVRYGLYLSGLMNEKDIEFSQHFIHGCGLSFSPDKSPVVRNTFIFVGCDGQTDEQIIYYGDDVYIRIYESGTDGYLYLQCESATISDLGEHLRLSLTQSPNYYCRFKMYHWNPAIRFETMGGGFPPNQRIIIQHAASGRNLCAEYRQWIPTFFGAECVASCHTMKDSHKMETAENMFKIVSYQERNISLYIRAAKGENIPADLLT